MRRKMIFDNHIHFNDDYKYKHIDIEKLITEGHDNQVGTWLCASFSVVSSVKAVEIAETYPDIYAAVAIHPNDVSNHNFKKDMLEIDKLCQNPRVVAIGETGLDYYYNNQEIKLQQKFFKEHINLSLKHNLALQIHVRDKNDCFTAYDDVLKITKNYDIKTKIIHCFSANKEYAEKFLEQGFYINIGGAVTFSNAKALQAAVKIIPLNKLLIETDAPYLTPHPHRGKINYPKYTHLIVEKIAELKGVSVAEVIEQTTKNAFKIFKI